MTPSRTNAPDTGFVSRRAALLGGGALLTVGAAGGLAARWFNVGARISAETLSVDDAYARAASGQIHLIDIRRPDEWARTGIGAGAVPLDMRRPDFADALRQVIGDATGVPVALICARGGRSRFLAARLRQAGFTRIIDVPEGMLGSGAGPGWLKRGLPVVSV